MLTPPAVGAVGAGLDTAKGLVAVVLNDKNGVLVALLPNGGLYLNGVVPKDIEPKVGMLDSRSKMMPTCRSESSTMCTL